MALTTALITGASSGIGYEISKILAAQGHDIVLVARRKDNLRQLAAFLEREHAIQATVVAEDLCQPGAPQRIYDLLKKKNIPVDILVNNAGIGAWGPFPANECQRELDVIQLNVAALTHLTRLFAVDMVKRGLGKILNVASVSGFVPGPYMAVYHGTKAFVVSFSESLRSELKGTGVSVTVVCPGPTASEFHHSAGTVDLRVLRHLTMHTSAQVARTAVKAMQKRKAIEIPGLLNKLLVFLPRFLPRSWVRFIAKMLLKP